MDTTNTTVIILAVVVAFVIGGMLGMLMNRRQRTKRLQDKFGPEYERTVNEIGDARQAEHDLETRLDHVRKLDIRPLSTDEIDRFTHDWKITQAEFVDEPLAAIQKSDRLIREVMKAKGYPVEDFEQRVADISVDYPELVADYRGLHLIALKGANESVNTEEMRQAMIHGRALFENLVNKDADIEDTHEHHEKEKNLMHEENVKQTNNDEADIVDATDQADIAHTDEEQMRNKQIAEEHAEERNVQNKNNTHEDEKFAPLFENNEHEQFRAQWLEIQSRFVDDPSVSVKDADELVSSIIKNITRNFADKRTSLEAQWKSGDDVSTEDLRVTMKRYRSFFDRLLTLES